MKNFISQRQSEPQRQHRRPCKVLLKGKDYETLNLVDYQINVYGQNIPGDQFEEVLVKSIGS